MVISEKASRLKAEGHDISFAFGKSYHRKRLNNDADVWTVLLEAKGVACVPGSTFAESRGMHISYNQPDALLHKGMRRIGEFFTQLS